MRLIFGLGALRSCGGGLPEGRAISKLLTICGVVIIKMTSKTNTRSSSGVMFNSFKVLWPRREVFFISGLNWLGLDDIKSHHDAGGEISGRRAADSFAHGDGLAHGIVPARVARTPLPHGIADQPRVVNRNLHFRRKRA